jgi:hypothetical protein
MADTLTETLKQLRGGRNILRNEGLNMSGAGVVMPPTEIPNAWGGALEGRPRPDAPEIYDRRKPKTLLRRT